MTKYYTGVGSRNLTPSQLSLLEEIGKVMASKGFTLRSGGADGADIAFQKGACSVNPTKTEIWIPWKTFNNLPLSQESLSQANYVTISQEQTEKAGQWLCDTGIMPWWSNCKQSVQKLHSRNVHQVVGRGKDEETSSGNCSSATLSKVCIYAAEEDEKGNVKGGTRTAVMASRFLNIPTYNILIDEQRDKLLRLLRIDN